ncbi:hypothetical protein A3Q56_04932, partial [Intoshia linei]
MSKEPKAKDNKKKQTNNGKRTCMLCKKSLKISNFYAEAICNNCINKNKGLNDQSDSRNFRLIIIIIITPIILIKLYLVRNTLNNIKKNSKILSNNLTYTSSSIGKSLPDINDDIKVCMRNDDNKKLMKYLQNLDDKKTTFKDRDANTLSNVCDMWFEDQKLWIEKIPVNERDNFEKSDKKYNEAIEEFLNTEYNYVSVLYLLTEVYYKRIEHYGDIEQFEELFDTYRELYNIHSKLILSLLHQRKPLLKSNFTKNLCDGLDKWLLSDNKRRLIGLYGSMMVLNTNLSSLFKSVEKKRDPKYISQIEHPKYKTKFKHFPLYECRQMVVQRITKYTLLLDAIYKYCTDDKEMVEAIIKKLKKFIFCIEGRYTLETVLRNFNSKSSIMNGNELMNKATLQSNIDKLDVINDENIFVKCGSKNLPLLKQSASSRDTLKMKKIEYSVLMNVFDLSTKPITYELLFDRLVVLRKWVSLTRNQICHKINEFIKIEKENYDMSSQQISKSKQELSLIKEIDVNMSNMMIQKSKIFDKMHHFTPEKNYLLSSDLSSTSIGDENCRITNFNIDNLCVDFNKQVSHMTRLLNSSVNNSKEIQKHKSDIIYVYDAIDEDLEPNITNKRGSMSSQVQSENYSPKFPGKVMTPTNDSNKKINMSLDSKTCRNYRKIHKIQSEDLLKKHDNYDLQSYTQNNVNEQLQSLNVMNQLFILLLDVVRKENTDAISQSLKDQEDTLSRSFDDSMKDFQMRLEACKALGIEKDANEKIKKRKNSIPKTTDMPNKFKPVSKTLSTVQYNYGRKKIKSVHLTYKPLQNSNSENKNDYADLNLKFGSYNMKKSLSTIDLSFSEFKNNDVFNFDNQSIELNNEIVKMKNDKLVTMSMETLNDVNIKNVENEEKLENTRKKAKEKEKEKEKLKIKDNEKRKTSAIQPTLYKNTILQNIKNIKKLDKKCQSVSVFDEKTTKRHIKNIKLKSPTDKKFNCYQLPEELDEIIKVKSPVRTAKGSIMRKNINRSRVSSDNYNISITSINSKYNSNSCQSDNYSFDSKNSNQNLSAGIKHKSNLHSQNLKRFLWASSPNIHKSLNSFMCNETLKKLKNRDYKKGYRQRKENSPSIKNKSNLYYSPSHSTKNLAEMRVLDTKSYNKFTELDDFESSNEIINEKLPKKSFGSILSLFVSSLLRYATLAKLDKFPQISVILYVLIYELFRFLIYLFFIKLKSLLKKLPNESNGIHKYFEFDNVSFTFAIGFGMSLITTMYSINFLIEMLTFSGSFGFENIKMVGSMITYTAPYLIAFTALANLVFGSIL